jgi:hypothetical protein
MLPDRLADPLVKLRFGFRPTGEGCMPRRAENMALPRPRLELPEDLNGRFRKKYNPVPLFRSLCFPASIATLARGVLAPSNR